MLKQLLKYLFDIISISSQYQNNIITYYLFKFFQNDFCTKLSYLRIPTQFNTESL